MNMIKKNTASRLDKVRALLVVGEEDGGSEIVQGNIQTAITKAGTSVTDMFSKITSGAA